MLCSLVSCTWKALVNLGSLFGTQHTPYLANSSKELMDCGECGLMVSSAGAPGALACPYVGQADGGGGLTSVHSAELRANP